MSAQRRKFRAEFKQEAVGLGYLSPLEFERRAS